MNQSDGASSCIIDCRWRGDVSFATSPVHKCCRCKENRPRCILSGEAERPPMYQIHTELYNRMNKVHIWSQVAVDTTLR